ncbi:hypothetical protein MTF65_02280 [Streptomyces sp. APSN-46.1]|uniref:hypothetical protein n=1 Tax=Streptomyces sp. APSN-46.1 TaxID=2929049 RepID=UPI001FB27A2F|nr:hypothetical protein [Streptomyces sp. APSN-46.1]MCJ1676205.1 hypothetical protein [Streptomyces sp. APSN-46.1]
MGSLAAAMFALAVPQVGAQASTGEASQPQTRAASQNEEACGDAAIRGRDQADRDSKATFRLCASTSGDRMYVNTSGAKCQSYVFLSWKDYDYSCYAGVEAWTLKKDGKDVADSRVYPGPGTYKLTVTVTSRGRRYDGGAFSDSNLRGEATIDVTFTVPEDHPKPPEPPKPTLSTSATREDGTVTVTVTNTGDRDDSRLVMFYNGINGAALPEAGDSRCHSWLDGKHGSCELGGLDQGKSTTILFKTAGAMSWSVSGDDDIDVNGTSPAP